LKRNSRKPLLIAGLVLAIIAMLFGASFIPTLWLDNGSMHTISGDWISVYYETREDAARDVFNLTEAEAGRLTQKLGFSNKQDLRLYIYDKQSTFQTKKYGLIALLLNLNWYIGDNRGSTVILASPGEAVTQKEYERRKYAAPHEMVHALNSILNPKMSLWLTEGAALYLANGNPPHDLYDNSPVPTLQQMETRNPVEFSNMGGYDFAHTYLESLDKTYGWDKVLTLLKTGDYHSAFGKTREAIYQEWITFLKSNYSKT
jgi:hypothetical protein